MRSLSRLSGLAKTAKSSLSESNILSDLGRSVTGNVETAILKIEDNRKQEKAEITNPPPTANYYAEAAKSLKKSIVDKFSKSNYKILKTAAGMLTDKVIPDDHEGIKLFRVQFNPSELTFFAHANEQKISNVQPGSDWKPGVVNAVEPAPVEMGFSLLFDHVNIYDAFMWDKMTMGVSASGITNAATAVASAEGQVWSVQPEVEGLLAALYNPDTRNVTFQWNDFSFHGSLTSVMATYTMFSVSGRPIRAKVDIRLRQVMNAADPWMEDYSKIFGKDRSSMVRNQQKIGSLLNLNL